MFNENSALTNWLMSSVKTGDIEGVKEALSQGVHGYKGSKSFLANS